MKKANDAKEKKPNKSEQEDILIEMLQKYKLLRSDEDIYAVINRNGMPATVSLTSDEFLVFVKSEYKKFVGSFPSRVTIKDCIDFYKNEAYSKEIEQAKHRIVAKDNAIIYNLGNGKCVFVDDMGWRVVDNTYSCFIQSKDELPQVLPIKSQRGWERLYRYLNISDGEKLLLTAYIAACFNPAITLPAISVNGTNGSGKSTLSRIVKKIIDPSLSEMESIPDAINNMRIRLNSSYYTVFDNLSKLTGKQSDFLCSVITGVSWTDRQFYTNKGIDCSHIKCSLCLNGISNFVFRADLAERFLFFSTRLIKESERVGDADIWKDFQKDLPYILGGIFDLLTYALRLFPYVKVKQPIRLVDFHKFGYAIAEAMGNKGEEFNHILLSIRDRQMEITSENSIFVRLMIDFLKEYEGDWHGTMSVLYKTLKNYLEENADEDKYYDSFAFPKAPNKFGAELRKYESALSSQGVSITFKKNSDGNMEVTLTTNWIIRRPIRGVRTPINMVG